MVPTPASLREAAQRAGQLRSISLSQALAADEEGWTELGDALRDLANGYESLYRKTLAAADAHSRALLRPRSQPPAPPTEEPS